jgi:cyclic beta-1,2-glucan synthetase
VTDVEVVDDYPSTVLAHARRQHRWVRGDWQILFWLLPFAPIRGAWQRNRLPLISRWKIFDNLRRSLSAPSMLALLVASWLVLPGEPLPWMAGAFLVLAFPVYPLLGRFLVGSAAHQGSRVFLRGSSGLPTAARALLTLTFLSPRLEMLRDRHLVRLVITQRRLLEWRRRPRRRRAAGLIGRNGVRTFYVGWRRPARGRGPGCRLASRPRRRGGAARRPRGRPVIAYWLSRPVATRRYVITAEDRAFLRAVARRTWQYFETHVGPADHWLPPDNYQVEPGPDLAHRTSPTNIAMGLVSTLAALTSATGDRAAPRADLLDLDTVEASSATKAIS